MADEIDVKKVAKLARLKLTEEEEKHYKVRFNEIIDYVGMLSAVSIESEMKEKDESLQVIYREDRIKESPVAPEQFSKHVENKFFKVPKVIE